MIEIEAVTVENGMGDTGRSWSYMLMVEGNKIKIESETSLTLDELKGRIYERPIKQ